MPNIIGKEYNELKDLFVFKLQTLLDVETELIVALPKMAMAATEPDLKKGFEQHLKETKEHQRRIQEAFSALALKPEIAKNKGLRGIVEDAEWLIKKIEIGTVRDAALVSSALSVEQYEIGCYGSAIEWAELLGYSEIKASLDTTLSEEQETADTLVELGTEKVYEEAIGEDENTEE